MKVILQYLGTKVGLGIHSKEIEWPAGWPLPAVGHFLNLPGYPNLEVCYLFWYPGGAQTYPDPHVWMYVTDPKQGDPSG